ncbi:vesicular, overexpressed in cancer, prosurvival protein 1-like [Gigantopelta aegis]|uniref:vesicular, overexpressed in cancer, prosurvival protein 1-like n=1 Tax=Gigantopelta aegis TaxID=1735272 RepID=UPI001B887956|nr:vesicular, overexpressed in cancer, prosurvival protein 1-like [Gigantopelta aegis]
MAYNDYIIVALVFIANQVSRAGCLTVCTYHFFSFGKKRQKIIYCDDWEYCCADACCRTTMDVYRLWYFWIGLLILTLVFITISYTWYKKKQQGRVISVGPWSYNGTSVETVTTQYMIQPHMYPAHPGMFNPTPAPLGPPPPYQQLSTYPELQQTTQPVPKTPGYCASAKQSF